jgi:mRNA interferase RelE/StbE
MAFVVRLTEEAVTMLEEIRDSRIRGKLFERIRKLEVEPEQQGKALVGDLAGYRSVQALGQRYRIVYRIDRHIVEVLVVGVGLRKAGDRTDVYSRTAHHTRSRARQ